MTRRETLGLLCAVPWLGLPLSVARRRPATIALQWDWEPDGNDRIDYFEVFVAKADAAAGDVDSVVTRVPGHLRGCDVALPNDDVHLYSARVRATNSHGSSVFTAPVILAL